MMENWVTSIGTAPIATAFFAVCALCVFLGRHVLKQQETILTIERDRSREVRELTVATNAALSSTSQALTASAASMNSARETMQVTTAVMERMGR